MKKRQMQLQADLNIGNNVSAEELLKHETDLLEMQANYDSKVREFKLEKEQIE